MTIEAPQADTLRIIMDNLETDRLLGGYRAIDCNNPHARQALYRIIGQALPSPDYLTDCNRLKIEVHPAKGGGCVICLERLRDADAEPPAQCCGYVFENSESAITEICRLYRELSPTPKSRLYKMTDQYILLITLPARQIERLSHYRRILRRPAELAAVREYGTAICKNALQKFGKFFR